MGNDSVCVNNISCRAMASASIVQRLSAQVQQQALHGP